MTRHSWLLPLCCFASTAVSMLVMLNFIWAHQLQELPWRWPVLVGLATLGLLAGGAHFVVARRLIPAIAWGVGVAFLSGVLLAGVLTTGFGS